MSIPIPLFITLSSKLFNFNFAIALIVSSPAFPSTIIKQLHSVALLYTHVPVLALNMDMQ